MKFNILLTWGVMKGGVLTSNNLQNQARILLIWWNHALVDNRQVAKAELCISLRWSSQACEIDFYKAIDKTIITTNKHLEMHEIHE
jgi:hypothetical protein